MLGSRKKGLTEKHKKIEIRATLIGSFNGKKLPSDDTVLAWHYGFTHEELEFILNYDIKSHLGRNTGEKEE